jgi:8-oxo-dGTP pyrophosphatase MutT (NUDIX family)
VLRWSGDSEETPWRAAALRELAEEVGILLGDGVADISGRSGADLYRVLSEASVVLDADALCYVGNWVTPRGLPRRFDTRIYVVEVPADAAAHSDRVEVYDPIWVTPRDALAAAAAGRWQVEVPTRAHLEMLAAAPGLDEVLRRARDTTPIRIEPRLAVDATGAWSVLLPGDPGFEEAGP